MAAGARLPENSRPFALGHLEGPLGVHVGRGFVLLLWETILIGPWTDFKKFS